jgi:hypothetical protein
MNLTLKERVPSVRGATAIYSWNAQGLKSFFYRHNMVMNSSTLATAKLWGGYTNYKAGAMYFEFQNLDNPADTPVYPAFDSSAGIEYYTGLQFSPNYDFLRVPVLIAPAVVATVNGYLLTLYAIAPDTDVGFWAKPFSGLANSVVIGGALVATLDDTQSNDVVLCRNYPAGTKVVKVDGEQIGMTWNVEFLNPTES